MKNIYEVKDFGALRKDRQNENNDKAVQSNFDDKHINPEAMKRVTEYVGLTKERLCALASEDPTFAKVLASTVAINSSRQGTKDESMVINKVAAVLEPYGVIIKNLGVNDFIPIRGTSKLLPRKEAKRTYHKSDLLKSFDFYGIIKETKQKIFGFAKICLGAGGHQDNVYHETREVVEWCREFGSEDTLYVFMIDTDDESDKYEKLETEEYNNIWICNHKTFQQRMLALISKKN